MSIFRIAMSTLTSVVLFAVCGLAAELKEPGRLMSIEEPGQFKAVVDDLLVVSLESNASLGPANPASNLEVKTEGDSLKKIAVVLRLPAKPKPGAPGRIEAYFYCEKAGETSVTVTPIKGDKKPGKALEFKVKVSENRE